MAGAETSKISYNPIIETKRKASLVLENSFVLVNSFVVPTLGSYSLLGLTTDTTTNS